MVKLGGAETVDGVKLSAKEKTDGGGKDDEGEEEEEEAGVMFRVILEKPVPEMVKLSRKNVAFVTIEQHDGEADEQDK